MKEYEPLSEEDAEMMELDIKFTVPEVVSATVRMPWADARNIADAASFYDMKLSDFILMAARHAAAQPRQKIVTATPEAFGSAVSPVTPFSPRVTG